jgi:hypothetical protein
VYRKSLGVLTAAAVVVLAVGVPAAYAAKVATHISVRGFDSNPGNTDDVFVGDLDSSKAKCERGRVVRMFKQTSTGFKLVDTDISSFHGAWGTRGNLAGTPPLKFTVARKSLNHGALICKAASVNLP